ncbi:helix-turn-helix domain-containing protein [Streptomyces sp. INA 01156]
MSRFRMYPTGEQAGVMLGHCAHARYVWNLAVEQHAHWRPGRRSAPGFAEQCRQLTEARRNSAWLRAGNAEVQQQALQDFARAKAARFASGFGEPTWRKRFVHEGFRVIGTDRSRSPSGRHPRLNARGRQVMGRSVVVQKLNRRWARVKVPGCGWVRFRLTRCELPSAKTFRVTFRNNQWHIAFAVIPSRSRRPARTASSVSTGGDDHRRPVRRAEAELSAAHHPGTGADPQAPAPRCPRPERQRPQAS